MQGNRLMLVIAVIAGVMATVLAFTYINSATSAIEEQEPEPQVRVLFVVNDLPANHEIDPDTDLRVDSIGTVTSPGLARSAVKADEMGSVRGLRISGPLPAGVPLLYSHLTSVQDINLPAGMRAMSISVSSENLMGGILVPGDHVDIIVSYRKPADALDTPAFDPQDPQAGIGALMNQAIGQASSGGVPSDWEAEEVLSNIRVIAIGDQLSVSRQAHMFGVAGSSGGGGSTITLELATEQAKELIRAQAGGNKLTLLLRPAGVPSETGGGSLQE